MRTHRPALPIERMIGDACGVSTPQLVPIKILMQCDKDHCQSGKWVDAHESWPEGTMKIKFECLGCAPKGFNVKFGALGYYDKAGRRLLFR